MLLTGDGSYGEQVLGAAQSASVTRNGFSAKLETSGNPAFGAEMSLFAQINTASVISAPGAVIPALQG